MQDKGKVNCFPVYQEWATGVKNTPFASAPKKKKKEIFRYKFNKIYTGSMWGKNYKMLMKNQRSK